MAAFDKVKSGFPGVDNILDFIRMGDNVVWQVNDIDEFRFFALPFVKQARQDGRSIIAGIYKDLGIQPFGNRFVDIEPHASTAHIGILAIKIVKSVPDRIEDVPLSVGLGQRVSCDGILKPAQLCAGVATEGFDCTF